MRKRLFFVSTLCLLFWSGAGYTAELLMFESDSCEWCEMWHEEIGVVYAKTAEAKIAPLRRVSIEDPTPGDLVHVRAVHYTPTFVVMENGEEVGRILGYPGEDFFWGLLDIELKKLEHDAFGDQAQSDSLDCGKTANREVGDEKTGGGTASC
jgi:thioredoxin-related protein